LVTNVEIRGAIRRKRNVGVYKMKWWNLNGENAIKLSEKIKSEGKWKVEGDYMGGNGRLYPEVG